MRNALGDTIFHAVSCCICTCWKCAYCALYRNSMNSTAACHSKLTPSAPLIVEDTETVGEKNETKTDQ